MVMRAAPLTLVQPLKYHHKSNTDKPIRAYPLSNPSNQKNVSGCGHCIETNALSTYKYRQFKFVHRHR